MAWDSSRPVPWQRLMREWVIYALIMVAVFLVFFRDANVIGAIVGVLISGPLYLALGAVLAKFGYQRKTFREARAARQRQLAARNAASPHSAALATDGSEHLVVHDRHAGRHVDDRAELRSCRDELVQRCEQVGGCRRTRIPFGGGHGDRPPSRGREPASAVLGRSATSREQVGRLALEVVRERRSGEAHEEREEE